MNQILAWQNLALHGLFTIMMSFAGVHAQITTSSLPTAVASEPCTTGTVAAREITQFATNSPFDVDYKSPLGGEGKRIWADSFLWEKAPKLEVATWITSQPACGSPSVSEGKFVLIEIWASWCSQSRKAIPLLNALQKKFEKELAVVAVTDEPEAVARAFAKKTPMHFAVGVDGKGRMKRALRVKGIPHVIIVEPGGNVVWEGFPLLKGFELNEKTVEAILQAGRKK